MPIHDREVPELLDLDVGGQYQWRRKGEAHILNPDVVAKLQHATQINSREEFNKYCQLIDEQQTGCSRCAACWNSAKTRQPIPLEEVEPAKEIVKRFATGAMSYGSISKEAHETLAIAMNRIGGKSNTGEGGEDPARYMPDANGDLRSQRHQASGQRPLWRDQRIPDQRQGIADQNGAGGQAGRRRPTARPQGRSRKSPASGTARRAWV